MKRLVTYFSCSGITKRAGEKLANMLNCDVFEIKPLKEYTEKDLDWMDKESRTTLEMQDEMNRPEILNKLSNFNSYDIIYIGFPIWWYEAPRIINTFLESYDFSGKTIVLYCTSGGSTIEKAYNKLKSKYDYNFKSLGNINSLDEDTLNKKLKQLEL